MAEAPFMPFFIGDYMADTTHLTTAQHGAYMLLLLACWTRGGALPDDNAELSRITRCRIDRWRNTVRPIMETFFQIAEGKWTHKRIDKELAKVRRRADVSRENGRLGGRQASTPKRAFMGEKNVPVEPTKPLKNNGAENPAGCIHTHTHKTTSKRAASGYVFEGNVIRLKRPDYDKWHSLYSAIPDFDAALSSLDDYYSNLPPEKRITKNWFIRASKALEKQHQQFTSERMAHQQSGFLDDTGTPPI